MNTTQIILCFVALVTCAHLEQSATSMTRINPDLMHLLAESLLILRVYRVFMSCTAHTCSCSCLMGARIVTFIVPVR